MYLKETGYKQKTEFGTGEQTVNLLNTVMKLRTALRKGNLTFSDCQLLKMSPVPWS
jgi:hypothetical protein